MCLATPMKVNEVNGNKAVVDSGDHSHEVNIDLLKDVKVGEYILAHGELAIQKLPEDEAKKILGMINTLSHEHH